MNYLDLKKKKKLVSFEHVDIYFVAFINIFLILGAIIWQSDFFYSFYATTALSMNIAALVTIILTRIALKEEILKENLNIISSLVFEIILLFSMPLHLLSAFDLPLLKTLLVLSIQTFSTIFFWKACKEEQKQLFAYLYLSGIPLFRKVSGQFSSAISKIPSLNVNSVRAFNISPIKNIKRS